MYVGGGSMLGLLAVWRALGLDRILRECWEAGVVLAGLSAGAMCWFEWGVTTSMGTPAPSPGLGFLPGSLSVHADGEPARLPVCRAAVADGHDPAGLRRRRRRRAAVPRTGAGGGRELAARPPRAARSSRDGETELKPRLLAQPDRFGPAPEIAEFRAVHQRGQP